MKFTPMNTGSGESFSYAEGGGSHTEIWGSLNTEA